MAYPLLNSLTQSTADRLRGLIQHAQDMPPVAEKGKRDTTGSKAGNKSKEFRKAMAYYV